MQNEIAEVVVAEVPSSDELMKTLQEMVACASANNSDPFTAMQSIAWD